MLPRGQRPRPLAERSGAMSADLARFSLRYGADSRIPRRWREEMPLVSMCTPSLRPSLEVRNHSDDLEVGIVRSIYKGSIKDFEFDLLPNRIFGAEVFPSKRLV